ncbi:MAG: hypothetical protein SNJ57_20825 [Cyanobacteriota bacterium]
MILRVIQEFFQKLGELRDGRSPSSAWFDAENWIPSPKSNAVLSAHSVLSIKQR